MTENSIHDQLKNADSMYQPFPSFSEWLGIKFNQELWERHSSELRALKEKTGENEDLLKRAYENVRRVAAVETGALEGLYKADRGFTFTAGAMSAAWDLALSKREDQERRLIAAQLDVYDHVLDFATGKDPIVQAWIRELHAQICSPQESHTCYLPDGTPQESTLAKGEYKKLTNHVLAPSGKVHAYAPVDIVETEMQRLCDQIRLESFQNAHSVLQASYVHYAFVAIHPFSDGNGRVARALSSVFMYRAESIPFLVTEDKKKEYFKALEESDNKNFEDFVDFVLLCGLDAIRLVSQGLKSALVGSVDSELQNVNRVYRTTGGYDHEQVDKAGIAFLAHIYQQISQLLTEKLTDPISFSPCFFDNDLRFALYSEESRWPVIKSNQSLQLVLRTASPAAAEFVQLLTVEVPQDSKAHSEVYVHDRLNGSSTDSVLVYSASISELLPTLTTSVELRTNLWIEELTARLLSQLGQKAQAQMRSQGY
jgi:Fic family protein